MVSKAEMVINRKVSVTLKREFCGYKKTAPSSLRTPAMTTDIDN